MENVSVSNTQYDHQGETVSLAMGRSQRKLHQSKRNGMKNYGTSTAKSKMDIEQRITESNRSYSASELRFDSQATFVSEQRNMAGSAAQQQLLHKAGPSGAPSPQ